MKQIDPVNRFSPARIDGLQAYHGENVLNKGGDSTLNKKINLVLMVVTSS